MFSCIYTKYTSKFFTKTYEMVLGIDKLTSGTNTTRYTPEVKMALQCTMKRIRIYIYIKESIKDTRKCYCIGTNLYFTKQYSGGSQVLAAEPKPTTS